MIKTIKMINCQSLKEVTLPLAQDRVNVIKAPNNTGKSILFKMLRITSNPKCFSASERKELIQWGTPAAVIAFEFTSGNMGYTKVLEKGVIYGYSVGGKLSESRVPDPFMLEEIGLMTSDGCVANLIDSSQDLLLVNPELRANSSLMKLLVYCEQLEKVRERAESIQVSINSVRSNLRYQSDSLGKRISDLTYVDVESMEQRYQSVQIFYNCLYSGLIPVYRKLGSLVTRECPDYNQLFCLLECLEALESIEFVGRGESREKECSLLECLEALESIEFVGRGESREKECSLLECLEVLESIKFVGRGESREKECSLLECLEVLESSPFQQLVSAVDQACLSYDTAESLKQELASAGEIYECPIYGKVVFDGKECVSCCT